MIKFKIKPYDVLFFGSGKPFNAGDTAGSIFPPFPHTFAGAICSKIYSKFKIDTSKILKEVYGPFLYNEENKKIYFPKPADIYTGRKGKDDKIYVLKLFDKNYKLFNPENTNKPTIISKFPIYIGEEEVEPFDGFISQDGLQKWIDGEDIEKGEIIRFKDIFVYEDRIGIRQDINYHTVKEEDGLYRIVFLRLKNEWSFVFWVEFNFNDDKLKSVNFIDENEILKFFKNEPKSLKLGGEMKNAFYEVERNDIKTTLKQPQNYGKFIKILFLTPATFDNVNDILPQISGMKIKSIISNGFVKLAIDSKGLNLKKYIKNALKQGSIIYAEIDNLSNQNLWFSTFQRTNNFIGTNLIIYSKGG